MPLTAASELQNHPTLSIPYKSSIIPGMVEQACGMVHKERKSLVDLKLLLTIFRGDHGWIPCGSLHTDGDLSLFPTDTLPVEPSDQHVEQATGSVEVVLEADNVCVKDIGLKKEPDGPENEPLSILDGVREPFASGNHQPGAQREEREARTCETEPKEHLVQEEPPVLQESKGLGVVVTTKILGKDSTERIAEEEGATVKGRRIDTSADDAAPTQKDDGTIQSPSPLEDDKTDKGSRMLTRGQAQAQASAASNTPRHESRSSPSLSSEPPLTIHPLYLPPANAIPSRNHGLPENEADDMRKILSALVQKQEEVVRGAEQMYEGLLKAQRLMRTVWRWCKAEAHVGEMSDGEDWVDAEEWGLDGPLKKGQVSTNYKSRREEMLICLPQEEVEDTTERRPRGRRTAQ